MGNDDSENEWCCGGPTPSSTPKPPTPSCSVSLPADFSLALLGNAWIDATITDQFGVVTQVNFSSSNISVASVSPASDTTENPYRTVVTGKSYSPINSAVLTAQVVMNAAVRCEAATTVTVTTPSPWWQVKDSDIFS